MPLPPSLSDREMRELADDRERSATYQDNQALLADREAANPALSPHKRKEAATAAAHVRADAQRCREDAATYRSGYLPGH